MDGAITAETPIDYRLEAARLDILADCFRRRADHVRRMADGLSRGKDQKALRLESAHLDGLAARLAADAKSIVEYAKGAEI